MLGQQSVERHEREYEIEGGGSAKLAVWRQSGHHWQAMAQASVGSFFHSSKTRDLGAAGTEAKAWESAILLAEYCLRWCLDDQQKEAARLASEAA